jgi:Recombination endonuclease VII
VIVPDGSKWCPDCSTVKPMSEFVKNASAQSGWSAYCKPCHNARGKASKDKVGGSRTYHLKRRYGITAEEADEMLSEQGGLCVICKVAPAVHVDHDHETGAVRALLCFNCNGGLGQFKDDPNLLHAAAYYVQFHTIRQQVQAEIDAARSGADGSAAPGPRR